MTGKQDSWSARAAYWRIRQADSALDTSWRKDFGAYYTPERLACQVAQAALRPLITEAMSAQSVDALLDVTIVDPAAGGGVLLVACLELLAQTANAIDPSISVEDYAQRMVANLYAVDLSIEALDTCREVLRVGQQELHSFCGNALLESLPETWPRSFDLLVANPPFGSVNNWGKDSPQAKALKASYSSIWQDKIDLSSFFVAWALEKAKRGCLIMPATFTATHKSQKLRAQLQRRARVRFFEAPSVRFFDTTPIATSLLEFECCERAQVEGWRCEGGREAAYEALSSFSSDLPSTKVSIDRAVDGTRWTVVSAELRQLWGELDSHADLGSHFLVGKGMETGFNKAFVFNAPQRASLPIAARRALRPRIRGKEIGPFHLGTNSQWLYWPRGAWEEQHPALQAHLELRRTKLEGRAAYKRGDCSWWQFTWPLHAGHYDMPRVICAYRRRRPAFAALEADGGIGLTDTTVVFVPDWPQAQALCLLLNSQLSALRLKGLCKETGKGMFEFFENQIRELPLPRNWGQLWPELLGYYESVSLERRQGQGRGPASIVVDELLFDAFELSDELRPLLKEDPFGQSGHEQIALE